MNTIKKCIFCLREKEMTDEHIVLDSFGGGMKIQSVCKDCNSKMGHELDGPFSKILSFELARMAFNVSGKSGQVPNPFSKFSGVTEDGIKVVMDQNWKPRVQQKIEHIVDKEGTRISAIFPKNIPEEEMYDCLYKSIIRILRKENSTGLQTETQLTEKAKKIAKKALEEKQVVEDGGEIKYSFTYDLQIIWLSYIKMAYEIMVQLFGMDYVSDSQTAELLRNVINNRVLDNKSAVRGEVPCMDATLNLCFTVPDHHVIVVFPRGNVYIRVFSISGLIRAEEKDSRFMLTEKDSKIYLFNYKTHNVTEMLLGDFLGHRFIPGVP